MQVDTFANRLKKAMNKKNMKQIELSEKTGFDKSLISNYLSGKYKAKQDKLTILAELLDVSETWLMGYNIDETTNQNTENSCENNIVKLPIFNINKKLIKTNNFLNIENNNIEINNLLIILINDNSMNFSYQKNDYVILNTNLKFNSGDDCLVNINGVHYFRRILKQDEKIILQSLNNNSESFYYTEKEFNDKKITIIGIAIELRRNIRGN